MRKFPPRHSGARFQGFLSMRINRMPLVLAFALVLTAAGARFAAAQNDPVLARVNGIEIKQSDLTVAEADIGDSLPADTTPEKKRELLLSYLINVNLLAQAAEQRKLDAAPNFAQRLAFARKKVLVQSLMENENKTATSDAAVKKFYDENLKPVPEVHVRHILVETEDQAKGVVKKLKAGEDFAKLAKELSKDPGSEGGDLGYITKDQVVPEFGNAAFALDKGKISDPVKTQFGWHVIKVEDKRDRKPPALDQIKDRIKAALSQKAGEELMQKIRATAKIENLTEASAAPDAAKKK
jgi:peptidyl-prolyl cis-trans isomerase C